MPRTLENPDRDFSATHANEPGFKDLRDLLKKNEIADLFDPIVRKRLGEVIARVAFDPTKQRW
jgi:hypothetical protein